MNLKKMRAYGEAPDDGVVQLNFTLPVAPSEVAKEAAVKYAEAMGFKEVVIASMEKSAEDFSCFVVFAHHAATINFEKIKVVKPEFPALERKQVEQIANKNLKRRLVILGATIGSDAHTLGIDAIMNLKGFKGDYGLESYKCFDARNLGSQVDPKILVETAKKLRADVILVSQVVTQKNLHIDQLKELKRLLEAEVATRKVVCIIGGPQIDHKLAGKLGFHGGFGPGTRPSEVASFLIHLFAKKGGKKL